MGLGASGQDENNRQTVGGVLDAPRKAGKANVVDFDLEWRSSTFLRTQQRSEHLHRNTGKDFCLIKIIKKIVKTFNYSSAHIRSPYKQAWES